MFSFILHDNAEDLFFVVRDHVGITPSLHRTGSTTDLYTSHPKRKASSTGAPTSRASPPPGHVNTDRRPCADEYSSAGTDPPGRPNSSPAYPHPPTPTTPIPLRTAFENYVVRPAWRILSLWICRRLPWRRWRIIPGTTRGEAVRISSETYDVTTVRGRARRRIPCRGRSRPCGLGRWFRGRGADEPYEGGYLYFHEAPGVQEFDGETDRPSAYLRLPRVRRGHECPGWGGTSRVPFLDPGVLEVAMGSDPNIETVRKGQGGGSARKIPGLGNGVFG